MNVLVTEQLSKRYGYRIGIDGLNLQVPEGALFGFLGPNGAGKTTTIRILLGFLKPGSGHASAFGWDCVRDSHRIKEDIGYVPGDLRLYPSLTANDALRWVGKVRRRDLTASGKDLIAEFDLDPDVCVRTMSRGMRQKLGLILALAHRPRLLVLDEPTTALDPIMQERLCRRLRDMAANGHTVFFSSHTLSEVEDLCDRVAILRQGRLVADERLDELRRRARRLVVIRWPREGWAQDMEAPPFLEVYDRRLKEWHASLSGPVTALVRWSASQPIDDISIGQPDLNRLFQQFYRTDGQ